MKSKFRVFLEGLGVAILVFVLCVVFISSIINSKLEKYYQFGYADGQKDCIDLKTINPNYPYVEDIGNDISKRMNLSLKFS